MIEVLILCMLLLLCVALLPEEVVQWISILLGLLFIGAVVGTITVLLTIV